MNTAFLKGIRKPKKGVYQQRRWCAIKKEKVSSFFKQIFDANGDQNYIGESISQLQHCAQLAFLAEQEGYDHEVIVAGFLHDVGHLIDEGLVERLKFGIEFEQMVTEGEVFGVKDHEVIGSEVCKFYGLPERVSRLILNHIVAKRYLVTTDKEYAGGLSHASRMTLQHQGGPLTEEQVKNLEKDSDLHLYIKLRKWDEKAKDVDNVISDETIQRFYGMIDEVVERSGVH